MDTAIIIELNSSKAIDSAKQLDISLNKLANSEKTLEATTIKLHATLGKLDSAFRNAVVEANQLTQAINKTEGSLKKLNQTLKSQQSAKQLKGNLNALAQSGQNFQTTTTKLQATLDKLDSAFRKTVIGVNQLTQAINQSQGGFNRLTRTTRRNENGFQKLNRTLDIVRRGLLAASSVVIAAAVIKSVVNYADAWFRVNAQVNLALRPGEDLVALQKKLFDQTQAVGGNLKSTVDLYMRLERSSRGYGVSQEELLSSVNAVDKAVQLSFSTTEAAFGALIQLGQGMSNGFQASSQELNSIIEQTPRLAAAIADGLKAIGVAGAESLDIGGLKKFATKYGITAKQLTDALISQNKVLDEEFKFISGTMQQGYNRMGNSILRLIGTTDQAIGVTQSLSHAMTSLANVMDTHVTPAAETWGRALNGNLTELDQLSKKTQWLLGSLISLGLIMDVVFEPFNQLDESGLRSAKEGVLTLNKELKKSVENLKDLQLKAVALSKIKNKNPLQIYAQSGMSEKIKSGINAIETVERRLVRARAELNKQTKLFAESQKELNSELTYGERIERLIGDAGIRIQEVFSETERMTQPPKAQLKTPTVDSSKLDAPSPKEIAQIEKTRVAKEKLITSYNEQIRLLSIEGDALVVATALTSAYAKGITDTDNKIKDLIKKLYRLQKAKEGEGILKELQLEKELLRYKGKELEIQGKIQQLHKKQIFHMDEAVIAQMRLNNAQKITVLYESELAKLQFQKSIAGLSEEKRENKNRERALSEQGYSEDRVKILMALEAQTKRLNLAEDISVKKIKESLNANKQLRDRKRQLFQSYRNQISALKQEGLALAKVTAIQQAYSQGIRDSDQIILKYVTTLHEIQQAKESAAIIFDLQTELKLLEYKGIELKIQQKIIELHKQDLFGLDKLVRKQMLLIDQKKKEKDVEKELAEIRFKTSLIGLSQPEQAKATLQKEHKQKGFSTKGSDEIIVANQDLILAQRKEQLKVLQEEITFKYFLLDLTTEEAERQTKLNELKKQGLSTTQASLLVEQQRALETMSNLKVGISAVDDSNKISQIDTEVNRINDAFDITSALILENTRLTAEMRTELEIELTEKRNNRLQQLELAKNSAIFQTSKGLFSNLAGISKRFAGEQSSLYKVMFAASKAFAVADSIVKIQQALASASMSQPFPANLAAIAAVVAATSSIISTIAGTEYAGSYDSGGMIPQGKVGLVGEKGPELISGPVMITSRRKTEDLLNQNSPENKVLNNNTVISNIISNIANNTKYAGIYDSGGVIPPGKVGLVGEKGPELISGPVAVTSRKKTEDLLNDKSSENKIQNNIRIINSIDPEVMGDYLGSDSGEEVILNVIRNNPETIRAVNGG